MLVLEIATQQVKGFSPTARAVLKPGYNVLVPPQGSGANLVPVFAALLYNDGRGGDASLSTGAGARVGMTFQSGDGVTFRLVRSLGGGGALHRLEPNRSWAVVSQDTAEIGQQLRQLLGLPGKAQFEELFSFASGQLPSLKPRASVASAAAPAGHGLAAGGGERSIRPNALVEAAMAASKKSTDPVKLRADLERLKAEVAAGKEIDEHQFRLEGVQRRIFELDEKLKQVDKLVAEVEQAKLVAPSQTHSLESLGLPPNGLELAARYDEAVEKLEAAINKLRDDEREAAERDGAARPEPVWLDRGFQVGMGVGALTFAMGPMFRGTGMGYLALLDIPAFGYAALSALRWIGELQQVASRGRKGALTKDREQKLQAAFDAEYFTVRAALKMANLETGKDLLEYLKVQEREGARLRDAETKLAEARSDAGLLTALDEQDQLAAEAKQLEERLSEMGAGATRSWREAEREMQEIEEALAKADSGSGEGGATALGGSFPAAAGGAAAKGEDPVPRLIKLAADLFPSVPEGSLGAALRERAGQYITAFTDRRYTSVEIDAKGQAALLAPGRTVPAGQLDDKDLDALYLSVKLTLLEKYAPLGKPLIVLDEPFALWDPPKQILVSRMLKHIASSAQILHASALPSHIGLADSTLQA